MGTDARWSIFVRKIYKTYYDKGELTIAKEYENTDEQANLKKNLLGNSIKGVAGVISTKAGVVARKSTESLEKSKETVFNAIDVNGDGQIDIEDVILMAFKGPGVSVDRGYFLRRELQKRYPSEIIEKAVAETPMLAAIEQNDIDIIADRRKRKCKNNNGSGIRKQSLGICFSG